MATPQEQFAKTLFLIVDRDNLFGSTLVHAFAKKGTVVLVTSEDVANEDEVIVVPFRRNFPQIPDGKYTHILFIWDKIDRELLEPLAKKASNDWARFFVIAQKEDTRNIKKVYEDFEQIPLTLIVGDLFGEGRGFILNKYLERAKAAGKVSLTHMGLINWFPILYADAVNKVSDLVLVSKKMQSMLFIGPPHPTTALSLFHTIQKIDPDLSVDFSTEKEEEENASQEDITSAFEHYDASGKLQQFYQSISVKKEKEEKTRQPERVAFEKPKEKKKKSYPILYVFYVLLIIAVVPVIAVVVSFTAGLLLLFLSVFGMQQGTAAQAITSAQMAQNCFAATEQSLRVVSVEAGVFGGGKAVSLLSDKVKLTHQAARIVAVGLGVQNSLYRVLSGKTLSPQDDVVQAVAGLKHFSSLLSQVDRANVPQQLEPLYRGILLLSSKGNAVIDELPELLGVNGSRTYLILFQDNRDLWPGGGVPSYYGVVKLHLGAVQSFVVRPVAYADSKLQGHIEPPFFVRRYVPSANLFMKDSSSDPDNPINAKMQALLLSVETGEKANGIISFDYTAVKGLLQSVGEVAVVSSHQRITPQNFYNILSQQKESANPSDFMSTFLSNLFVKASQGKQLFASLLTAAPSLLEGKDAMVVLASPVLQQAFSLAGLSGSLVDSRVDSPTSFNDTLGSVEANVSMSTASAQITRKLFQSLSIDEQGNARESVSLQLTNNSGNVYRSYLRFLFPEKASLQAVALNSIMQPIIAAQTDPAVYESKRFIPAKGLEVARETEEEKALYGFLVSVPTNGSLSVDVTYEIAHAFSTQVGQLSYNQLVWKQPGVDPYFYQLTVAIPQSGKFLGGLPQPSGDGLSATYTTTITKDTTIPLKFSLQ